MGQNFFMQQQASYNGGNNSNYQDLVLGEHRMVLLAGTDYLWKRLLNVNVNAVPGKKFGFLGALFFFFRKGWDRWDEKLFAKVATSLRMVKKKSQGNQKERHRSEHCAKGLPQEWIKSLICLIMPQPKLWVLQPVTRAWQRLLIWVGLKKPGGINIHLRHD